MKLHAYYKTWSIKKKSGVVSTFVLQDWLILT